MNENPYMMLAKVILPSKMTEYFDLIKVRTDEYFGEPRLHLYLDEKEQVPDNRTTFSQRILRRVLHERLPDPRVSYRSPCASSQVEGRRWQERIKGLADGCQGHSLLQGVCDFFKST